MRTSNKITLIAGLSAIALVGTGYAAWTFSKDATATAKSNVNITTKADEVGTLALAKGQTFVLTLDQDFIGWQKTANDNNTSDVSTIKLEYTGSEEKDYKDGYAVDEKIKVTMTADYGALSTYVTFGALDADLTKEYKYTGTKLEFEFNLPTVSYIDDMYPRNEKAFNAMVTAIGSAEVNFTFTATVEECTHA